MFLSICINEKYLLTSSKISIVFIQNGEVKMKISETFIKNCLGAGLVVAVVAPAIYILIQFVWTTNTKLVKVEVENSVNTKELVKMNEELVKLNEGRAKIINEQAKTNEELVKVNEELLRLNDGQAKITFRLDELEGVEPRVESNEKRLNEAEKQTNYLKGQVETLLSKKPD